MRGRGKLRARHRDAEVRGQARQRDEQGRGHETQGRAEHAGFAVAREEVANHQETRRPQHRERHVEHRLPRELTPAVEQPDHRRVDAVHEEHDRDQHERTRDVRSPLEGSEPGRRQGEGSRDEQRERHVDAHRRAERLALVPRRARDGAADALRARRDDDVVGDVDEREDAGEGSVPREPDHLG